MRRSDKRGHGQFFQLNSFPAFRVKAHGMASRQQKHLAFRRERHEFVRARQCPFLPATAKHEQIGVIVYPALRVGKKQAGLGAGICGHGGSVEIVKECVVRCCERIRGGRNAPGMMKAAG